MQPPEPQQSYADAGKQRHLLAAGVNGRTVKLVKLCLRMVGKLSGWKRKTRKLNKDSQQPQ